MARTAKRPSFASEKYSSDDFELPPNNTAHDLIKYKMFTWELLPEMPEDGKRIILKCNLCQHSYRHHWPVNWTTLVRHYEKTHHKTREDIKREDSNYSSPDVPSTPASTADGSDEGKIKSDTAKKRGLNASGRKRDQKRVRKTRGPIFLDFDKDEYTKRLLAMIVSNDISLSLVDSASYKEFVSVLRPDTPNVSRSTLNRDLTNMYEKEIERLKQKFAEHTGQFALKVNEWKSSNNGKFLWVTLHFYNDDFVLETYTIGFEPLDENDSFSSSVFHPLIKNTLQSYDIEKRIVAITRDNARQMDHTMNSLKADMNTQSIEFDGDARCIGQILTLVSEDIFKSTFFKENETPEKSFLNIVEKHPSFQGFAKRMKCLPSIIRQIILQMAINPRMNKVFKSLLVENRERQSAKHALEITSIQSDIPWLTTYKMIDQFVNFREEITKVFELIHQSPEEDVSDLEKLKISEDEWDYLENVRDIVKVFQHAFIKLQNVSRPVIQQTIPMVFEILQMIESPATREIHKANPFLAFGLDAVQQHLLEYYPIGDESISSLKMLYITIVLDPRYKLDVFNSVGFSETKISAIKTCLHEVYHSYENKVKEEFDSSATTSNLDSSVITSKTKRVFQYFDQSKEVDKEHEIERYLTEKREPEDQDIIAFFESQKEVYPILYRIAKDYFAVPAMSTPTESQVSRFGNLFTKKTNDRSTIKMLAVLKSQGIIESEDLSQDNSNAEVDGKVRIHDLLPRDGINDKDGDDEAAIKDFLRL